MRRPIRVVLSAAGLADNANRDVVVWLHEAAGGWAKAALSLSFDYSELAEADLLERPGRPKRRLPSLSREPPSSILLCVPSRSSPPVLSPNRVSRSAG